MIKYIIGILILIIIGFTGGNIIFTAIEIAVIYSVLDVYDDGGPRPPGTT
jgi:hypothetical protein